MFKKHLELNLINIITRSESPSNVTFSKAYIFKSKEQTPKQEKDPKFNKLLFKLIKWLKKIRLSQKPELSTWEQLPLPFTAVSLFEGF